MQAAKGPRFRIRCSRCQRIYYRKTAQDLSTPPHKDSKGNHCPGGGGYLDGYTA